MLKNKNVSADSAKGFGKIKNMTDTNLLLTITIVISLPCT